MRIRDVAFAWAAALLSMPAFAQDAPSSEIPPGAQIQRLQQQQLEAARELNPRPIVMSPAGESAATISIASLAVDSPCFEIERLVLDDSTFEWLARFVQPVVGQCIGKIALKQIQDAANNALIDRGYLTSRVLVPTQSLQSGTLMLAVVPGRLAEIRTDGAAIGWLRTALPTVPGKLLNQRDIDQALENLRRLRSQSDATFDIAPGAREGESELVLHPGAGKQWHMVLGIDNAGLNSTGKTGLSGSLTYDSPLYLFDQLQIAGATNANFGAPGEGTRSIAANYSVPIGYAMFSVGASRSRYKQTVPAFDGPVQYNGVQSQLQAGLSGVIFRNASARTELHGDVYRRINRNTYDGVELPAQTRDVMGYELGLSHRQYVGRVVMDAAIAWRASLPGLSNRPGMVLDEPDFDGKTEIGLASVGVQLPFEVSNQSLSYRFDWNTQNARTPLSPADYFTIGTRYSVRGFNQQMTLAAESGWSISNELDWYLPAAIGTQSIYAGVDLGRVRGRAADFLTGQTLMGAVLGARGQVAPKNPLGAAFIYDLSVGWPLSRPAGISGSPTFLFQIGALF
ncbi:ShlB/FhaC/HecB family hemolysin secretion/activation protein [Trinickia sp. NRRL B-1857]|uniref:ShlB/FhaC/HecB family hemolysin secretion/activation protein n=1 Tax=Trinickia sp. NRRL B-1857 TaxID=3162879 RepID=UPI003D2E55A4